MEPAFVEPDRVLTYNWGPIIKGSVIVFKEEGKYLIKRVKELKKDHTTAVSDNKKLANKEYRVKINDVIGRVFLKY